MAPEQILDLGHDYCVDMWALGILTYELFTTHIPFCNDTTEQLLQEIVNVDIKPVYLQDELFFSNHLFTDAKAFIENLLLFNLNE